MVERCASPYHLEVFVKTEGFVGCNDWHVFHEGLRDDVAVEGSRVFKILIGALAAKPVSVVSNQF